MIVLFLLLLDFLLGSFLVTFLLGQVVLVSVAGLTHALGVNKPVRVRALSGHFGPSEVVVAVVAHALRVMLQIGVRASKNAATEVLGTGDAPLTTAEVALELGLGRGHLPFVLLLLFLLTGFSSGEDVVRILFKMEINWLSFSRHPVHISK